MLRKLFRIDGSFVRLLALGAYHIRASHESGYPDVDISEIFEPEVIPKSTGNTLLQSVGDIVEVASAKQFNTHEYVDCVAMHSYANGAFAYAIIAKADALHQVHNGLAGDSYLACLVFECEKYLWLAPALCEKIKSEEQYEGNGCYDWIRALQEVFRELSGGFNEILNIHKVVTWNLFSVSFLP